MLGEPTSMIKARANREANEKWINSHYYKLKTQYLDRWVAVKNQKVIASDTDYKGLVNKLRNQYGKAFCEIAIDYVTNEPLPSTILWLSVSKK